MNEMLSLPLILLAGFLLGILFFGGLWFTVQKALVSDRAGLWFIGSMLLRSVAVLTGFYYTAGRDWKNVLGCLTGFVLARYVVTYLTKSAKDQKQKN